MSHRNLLVVEDDDAIRRLLVEYFTEHAAIDVDSARDGAEALHRISAKCYSVIVLDVLMPHMSGIDVLNSVAALSSDPSLPSLEQAPPVIVITGAPQDVIPTRELERRFPLIVRGVLRKPLDIRELARCVQSLL